MKYTINPHIQVVIGLYETETFLTPEHQEMLRDRRDRNPNDTLYFVYDSQLFPEKNKSQNQKELEQFCSECQLKPFDIQKEIRKMIHTKEFTSDEKELFACYEDEIAHLEQGGSLESAKHYIRWFNKILRLGIYTDIEVVVNTHGLPAAFTINEPALLNIYDHSIPMGKKFIKESGEFQNLEDMPVTPIIGSDIIILSYTHEEEALAFSGKMQKALWQANHHTAAVQEDEALLFQKKIRAALNPSYIDENQDIFTKMRQIINNALSQHGLSTDAMLDFPAITIFPLIQPMVQEKSRQQVRQWFLEQTHDNLNFCQYFLKLTGQNFDSGDPDITQKTARLLRDSMHLSNDSEPIDDKELINRMRQVIQSRVLTYLGEYSSGDIFHTVQMCPKLIYTKQEYNDHFASKSLKYYGFDKRFISLPNTLGHNYLSPDTPTVKPLSIFDTELEALSGVLNSPWCTSSQVVTLESYRNADKNAIPIYTLNLHSHVKIWLSKDPSLFMNLENQLRLIQMRDDNPNDTIHLVYDSHLLNSDSQIHLISFCQQYYIEPQDVRVLMKETPDIKETLDLYDEIIFWELYQQEITHLSSGGNLGAASDLLRILGCVCQLGFYSDFDVKVKTNHLPQTMELNKPIIFNLGSIITPDMDEALECPIINNDVFAVADIHSNEFREVQRATLLAYQRIDYDKLDQNSLTTTLLKSIDWNNDSPIATRQNILQMTSNNHHFVNLTGYNAHALAESHRKALHDNFKKIPDITYCEARLTMLREESDDSIITHLRQSMQFELLKTHVMHSSGAAGMRSNFFSELAYPRSIFQQNFAPFSMDYYGLATFFITENAFPLGSAPPDNKAPLADPFESKILSNDVSWTNEGVKLQCQRENILQSLSNISHVDLSKTLLPHQADALLKRNHEILEIWEQLAKLIYVEKWLIYSEKATPIDHAQKVLIEQLSNWVNQNDLDIIELQKFLQQPTYKKIYLDHNILNKTLQTLLEKLTTPILPEMHDDATLTASEVNELVTVYANQHPDESLENICNDLIQEKISSLVRKAMAEYRLQNPDQKELNRIKEHFSQRWTSVIKAELKDLQALDSVNRQRP